MYHNKENRVKIEEQIDRFKSVKGMFGHDMVVATRARIQSGKYLSKNLILLRINLHFCVYYLNKICCLLL